MQGTNVENRLFFSKYKPDKKIGEGSFGKIYAAHNITTGEKFALKLEGNNVSQSLLEQEACILCYLKGEGIPFVKSYGYSGDHNVLVMELLGKSLEELFQDRNCRFSVKTVCMIALQLITRLQYIHNRHILHRDIKPDNFTIGTGNCSHKIYVIDFGLSKKYRSSRTLKHIKYSENKKLTGTARYASIHALKGCEQGRRDDMEAIGYVLLYFLRGSLPWQGLKVKRNEDRYLKIYEKKRSTSPAELCAGFPPEFCEYVTYTRKLLFEEEPNYDYLRNLMDTIMKNKNYTFDYVYDWCDGKKPDYLIDDIYTRGTFNNNSNNNNNNGSSSGASMNSSTTTSSNNINPSTGTNRDSNTGRTNGSNHNNTNNSTGNGNNKENKNYKSGKYHDDVEMDHNEFKLNNHNNVLETQGNHHNHEEKKGNLEGTQVSTVPKLGENAENNNGECEIF